MLLLSPKLNTTINQGITMALKPIESIKINAINATVTGLKLANLPMETILNVVSTQVAEFEATTTYRVKLHDEVQENGTYFSLIDTKKDFVRARKSGENFQVLRSKVFGVPIDVKAAKDGEYSFTNEQISSALQELAILILALPKEARTAGNDDFKSAPDTEEQEPENEDSPDDNRELDEESDSDQDDESFQ